MNVFAALERVNATSFVQYVGPEDAPAILGMVARGMRSFDKATAKYWCEWLEVGLEDTPVRETWRELEKMVATYFPGRGTLFEETYLEGKAEGKAEARAESILSVLEKRGIPSPRTPATASPPAPTTTPSPSGSTAP